MGEFKLEGLEEKGGLISINKALGAIGDLEDASRLRDALGEVNHYAESIPVGALDAALGAIQLYHGMSSHPAMPHIVMAHPNVASRSAANMARLHSIINASMHMQARAVDRPNVMMVFHFDHPGAGVQRVDNAKCTPPGIPTTIALALQFVQACAYLLESDGGTSRYGAVVVDLRVQEIPFAQYAPLSPATVAPLTGMPLEVFAPASYQASLQPPQLRGLTYANVNTLITVVSTATSATRYAWVLFFRMAQLFGPECGNALPSLFQGPTALRHYSAVMRNGLYLPEHG